MRMWSNVENMFDAYEEYKEVKPHFTFLPSFTATFWNEYEANATRFDRMFLRTYRNFRYFDQKFEAKDMDKDLADWLDFRDAVEAHLLANQKRYEELYRIHVIADSAYDIFGNIDITETKHGTMVIDHTNVDGARSDSGTDTVGARTNTSEDEVSAFNAETYTKANKTTDTRGAGTDTSSFTKGAQTNTQDGTDTEDYTITKKGKMNIASNEDLIRKHINLWSKYEFITYIFKQIAEEFLLV